MLRRLSDKFPAAENLGQRKLDRPVNESGPYGHVGHEALLVDAVTIGKRISVEKDVPGDGAPVGEGKYMKSETRVLGAPGVAFRNRIVGVASWPDGR